MKKKFVEAVVTCIYVGKIPFMPGTWGTLITLPLVWLLALLGPFVYVAGTFSVIFLGSYFADIYESYATGHDPSEVVIDEVAGTLITMMWLPLTWQTFVLGFLLFRFFDILKPFPIGYIDRKVSGGFGTVLDDVAAGLVANVLLQVVYTNTAWLGVQLHAT